MLPSQNLTPQQVAGLLAAMGGGDSLAYKNAGTTPGIQLHGPGGLLGQFGLNQGIINAMVLPRGLAGRLRVIGSTNTNELQPILTGLTASSGSENTTACADAPTVGNLKICIQTHPFGRMSRESTVLQLDLAGQLINRGEFRDNVLYGRPATDANQRPGPIDWATALRTEVGKKMAELYAGYFRDFARLIYTGNPANTAGNTGYQEYRGLDLLISTGKRDAITGALCAAADSTVIDFNGLNTASDGATIYAYMAAVYNKLNRLAVQTGHDPVEWVLTMTFGAFYELTAIWPCVYATARCNQDIVRTSSLEEQVRMRDEMRNGSYLLIEGKPIPVIIDDAITETVPGAIGTYESDIYLVPLRAGGRELTYFEHFNMNEEAVAAASAMAPAGSFAVEDNGRFLLHRKPPSNECVQVRITERPRLRLDAPFLAARWTNLRYTITANQHQRDPFPSDPYFVNGGNTQQPLPYFYPQSTTGL